MKIFSKNRNSFIINETKQSEQEKLRKVRAKCVCVCLQQQQQEAGEEEDEGKRIEPFVFWPLTVATGRTVPTWIHFLNLAFYFFSFFDSRWPMVYVLKLLSSEWTRVCAFSMRICVRAYKLNVRTCAWLCLCLCVCWSQLFFVIQFTQFKGKTREMKARKFDVYRFCMLYSSGMAEHVRVRV